MKQPETLKQLLKTAAVPLWKGLAYERTAIRNVEEFIEIVGDLALAAVTTVVIDGYRSKLTVAESTINRKLTNVNSLLKFAVDRDWLIKMPKMPWEKETEGRVRWLSDDEETRMFGLLAEWGQTETAKFLRVLLETGMRRGELLDLTPSQIDGNWVRLWKTKTKKARSVPLNAKALDALSGFKTWTVTESSLRQIWDKLRGVMLLTEDKDFVLHSLRHTAATRTLKKTQNIVVVKKLLGHSNIKTTLRYAHLADDELLAAVQ